MNDITREEKSADAGRQGGLMQSNNLGAKADPADFSEDDFDEPPYSSLKGDSLGDTISRMLVRSNIPLLIILAGVVVLIVVTLVFFPGRQRRGAGTKTDLAALQARITRIEGRLSQIESAMATTDKSNTGDARYDQLKDRVDNLETSLSQQMDQLSRKVDEALALERETASRPAVAPQRTSLASARTETPRSVREKTTAAARYHTVRRGDTLYHISRENGLTVTRLRALNHLRAGEPIQPGQRLRLTP